jgi:hypothetical protein
LGLVSPGRIDDVRLVRKSDSERGEYDRKMTRASAQKDLFRSEYKELEFLPFDVQLAWRCIETCAECRRTIGLWYPKRPAQLDLL